MSRLTEPIPPTRASFSEDATSTHAHKLSHSSSYLVNHLASLFLFSFVSLTNSIFLIAAQGSAASALAQVSSAPVAYSNINLTAMSFSSPTFVLIMIAESHTRSSSQAGDLVELITTTKFQSPLALSSHSICGLEFTPLSFTFICTAATIQSS